MLWPLSVVLVANTNGRLAIPALAGLLVTVSHTATGWWASMRFHYGFAGRL